MYSSEFLRSFNIANVNISVQIDYSTFLVLLFISRIKTHAIYVQGGVVAFVATAAMIMQ